MITKKGTVVKLSSEKTIKVEVVEYLTHPKYKKRFQKTKNFLVHADENTVKVGDSVLIAPCRPISKRKSWTLSEVLS